MAGGGLCITNSMADKTDLEDELNKALSGMNAKHVTFCFEYTRGETAGNMSASYRVAYDKGKKDEVKQQAYLLSKRTDVRELLKILNRMDDERFEGFDGIIVSILEDPNEKSVDRIAAYNSLAKVHARITKKIEVTEKTMSRQDVLDKLKRMEEGT